MKRFEDAIRSFDVCLAHGTRRRPCTRPVDWPGVHGALRPGNLRLYAGDFRGRRTASLLAHRAWAYLFSGAAGLAVRDFNERFNLTPPTTAL